RRMRAAELRQVRQNPGGAQTFGDRTADDAPQIEILIEMSAQRMTGAFHLLRTPVDVLAFLRQSESVVQPVEQAKLENLLQPLDAAHDCWCTAAQRGRGLAKTQSARNDDENAQIIPRNTLEQRGPDGLLH